MMNDNVFPTLNALVQFISVGVAKHYKTTGKPLDGATLANRIRRDFPGFSSYEQLGISKLGEAVEEAEKRGLVLRNKEVLHLEMKPGPSADMAVSATPQREANSAREYVRLDIWRAVAFLPQKHDRFYDRETGRLVDEREEPSADLSDTSRYVKLDPVSSDEQHEWASTHFKDANGFSEDILEGERWWVKFAGWLKQQDRETLTKWNRHRAQKVCDFLKEWAETNKVPPSGLFVAKTPREFVRASKDMADDQKIRIAVARIVGEMDLDELKDLQLPLKYVLRYFRVK